MTVNKNAEIGDRELQRYLNGVTENKVTNLSPSEVDEAIKCHHICRKNEPAMPWVKTMFKLRDRKSSSTVQVSAGACRCVVCIGGEP